MIYKHFGYLKFIPLIQLYVQGSQNEHCDKLE